MATPNSGISDKDRQRQSVEGIELFSERARVLANHARLKIRIFSNHLEPYASDDFYKTLSQMLIQHPNRQACLLVRDTPRLIQNDHRLVELSQRLPSRLQIRKLNPEYPVAHAEFMLVDDSGILYCREPDQYQGYSIHYAPALVAELAKEFDHLWENSLRDPGLLRLHL